MQNWFGARPRMQPDLLTLLPSPTSVGKSLCHYSTVVLPHPKLVYGVGNKTQHVMFLGLVL